MIHSSPSPTIQSTVQSSPSLAYQSRARHDSTFVSTLIQPCIANPSRSHPHVISNSPISSFLQVADRHTAGGVNAQSERSTEVARPAGHPQMVDASTQYSPPGRFASPRPASNTLVSGVAGLNHGRGARSNVEKSRLSPPPAFKDSTAPLQMIVSQTHLESTGLPATSVKRSTSQVSNFESSTPSSRRTEDETTRSPKRPRAATSATKLMPMQYETCDTHDLVILISSMLMELIRYNDSIPLRDGHLTRFHSRAPPGISVLDYLHRLATHATLSPPILLSMVYYIDMLCALYPAFTISSLTVHRFLITSATVASKGLSDSFWTNKTYARVGGVSIKELALLELEFLWRVEWRIVPKPEVLVDYYRSLVERSDGYEIDITGKLGDEEEAPKRQENG